MSTTAFRRRGRRPAEVRKNIALDCGWGRLVFAETFDDPRRILSALRAEEPGRRDICVYSAHPQVLVGLAPNELFIDPSYTYRLQLHRYRPRRDPLQSVTVRKMRDAADAEAVNRIYSMHQMVTAPPDILWANQRTRVFTYLVAEDGTGRIVGTVTGVDHTLAFNDPHNGTSLWCLAVDPTCTTPAVGEALVRTLAERYVARGRSHLDLSVLHDNTPAMRLYEKLGFECVPVMAVKRKNPINEPLFAPIPDDDINRLNPYARLVAVEALRRGIWVEVTDAEWGEMRLSHGGRTILTRESLSELTSAVAMSRCDDKRVTRRILHAAGIRVPRGRTATFDAADTDYLHEIGEVVVKPARGEQGRGITVGVTDEDALHKATDRARNYCPDVLLEEYVAGEDLRIVVIGHQVVAAAVRRPATVVGTGKHTVRELIEALSRRRAAATGGESRVPVDETTADVVQAAGFHLDAVLPESESLAVRRTANLHTGGTIHDVTEQLHPELAQAALTATRAIGIPVTGLDLLVRSAAESDYVMIEANERPGLANHEPQPTAQRFIDLLFPETHAIPTGWKPSRAT